MIVVLKENTLNRHVHVGHVESLVHHLRRALAAEDTIRCGSGERWSYIALASSQTNKAGTTLSGYLERTASTSMMFFFWETREALMSALHTSVTSLVPPTPETPSGVGRK